MSVAFKNGDKVKVVNPQSAFHNDTGIIVNDKANFNGYEVAGPTFGSSKNPQWFAYNELQAV